MHWFLHPDHYDLNGDITIELNLIYYLCIIIGWTLYIMLLIGIHYGFGWIEHYFHPKHGSSYMAADKT